jgi:hypothetical protein
MKETVRVYRNLTRNCFSVQTYVSGKGWRLSYHVQTIRLVNVTTKVSESARQRSIKDCKKYVHAFVEGQVSQINQVQEHSGTKFGYRLADGAFIDANGQSVNCAKVVTISPNQMYYY